MKRLLSFLLLGAIFFSNIGQLNAQDETVVDEVAQEETMVEETMGPVLSIMSEAEHLKPTSTFQT